MVNTVLDANCWCARIDELMRGNDGLGVRAYSKAESIGKIVFDNDGHIRQQYIDARKGFGEQIFNIFFEEAVLKGKIEMVPSGGNATLRNHLILAGLPRKELHYFQAAHSANAAYIVSEDIDFFEPKLKAASERSKARAKANRTGCICKLARKLIGAEIFCLDDYVNA